MLDPDRYDVLSFDCYGTLIDWGSGILSALSPVLADHGIEAADHDILRLFSESEAIAEDGPYVKYAEVLARTVRRIGKELGFEPSQTEAQCLTHSIGRWPPFPDTVDALRRLKHRYRLAIISNVDDDLFALSAELLEVEFDWVITAEQARSYKPAATNFRLAMRKIAVAPDNILHVAESVRHDIVPASALGLSTVWVNRATGAGGAGAASGALESAPVEADLQVPDLKSLVAWMDAGRT